MFCGSLDGRGVWGRMNTCICMAGSLCCSLKLSQHCFLLISYVLCSVPQLCPTLCNPLPCSPPGPSVHGDSPGKNTGVVCHALLQRIFPTQGSNPGLPHCRQILYCLSHQGSLLELVNEFSKVVVYKIISCVSVY